MSYTRCLFLRCMFTFFCYIHIYISIYIHYIIYIPCNYTQLAAGGWRFVALAEDRLSAWGAGGRHLGLHAQAISSVSFASRATAKGNRSAGLNFRSQKFGVFCSSSFFFLVCCFCVRSSSFCLCCFCWGSPLFSIN